MLSKSQARAFFLGGTALCSVAFIGLTLDTFRQIPKQTNQAAITPEVIKGKELWTDNNCMGCHTLFGEGAYYAPELTKVYERRGEAFIRAMLTDPEAMYPGQRKMKKYSFSEDEKTALVAFFKWAGQVDLNGFPAKPPLGGAMGEPAVAQVDDKRPVVFKQICTSCHSLDGQGGTVGPALDGVGGRRDAAYLRSWLTDPTAVKADSKMPKLPLTPEQIDELVKFLETKR
ncbi:MAG: c-type cytochrome [Polyangiaceae bacterium]